MQGNDTNAIRKQILAYIEVKCESRGRIRELPVVIRISQRREVNKQAGRYVIVHTRQDGRHVANTAGAPIEEIRANHFRDELGPL